MINKKVFNIVTIFFLVFSFLFCAKTISYADSSGTYQSYINLFDAYRTAQREYATSKNKYLTYKTLKSQEEALLNGTKFLKMRDQLLSLYLKYLMERVTESGGYSAEDRALIIAKLKVESDWLIDHRTQYDSAGTLQDVQRLSDRMQERYTSVIRYTSLQTSGSLLSNKVSNLINLTEDLTNQVSQQLIQIKSTNYDTSLMERWVLEAQNKVGLAKDKMNNANEIFNNLHNENLVADYQLGKTTLTEATQYLKEADNFLGEVIKNIKGE